LAWQPGPGFLGEYRFVFIGRRAAGPPVRKDVIVRLGR